MNSIRSLHRAVEHEIGRQIAVLEAGGVVVQETRHWDEAAGVTSSMRSKEESEDYRYFQEPDLLPLEVDAVWRDRVEASLPELPAVRTARYAAAGVDAATASQLVDDPELFGLFDEAVTAGADARTTANWLTGEVVAHLRRTETAVADSGLVAEDLVELEEMVAAGTVSATAAKDVLGGVLDGEGRPQAVAEARDLLQISDTGVIESEVDAVLAANPDAVAKMRDGDMKPIGFLVGQVMKATGGKADPRMVSELLRSRTTG
jgi:aspartyl-tRNA(Asn)/glutamyl-tRNA(Gln) amidotransferase subunit B